jgi:hypothetical protein
MARDRKGAPHQVKHFQPEDHAHAAHQEEASRSHTQKRGRRTKGGGKVQPRLTDHPVEVTPRGPRRGQ